MNSNYQDILEKSKSMDHFHGSLLLVSTMHDLMNELSDADGHQDIYEASQYADLLLVYTQEYKQRIESML